nr:MAG TPA: hypothetical protein [Caudoviricetes sp.]
MYHCVPRLASSHVRAVSGGKILKSKSNENNKI